MAVIVILVVSVWFIRVGKNKDIADNSGNNSENTESNFGLNPAVKNNLPQTSVIASGLDTPWAIVFLPDDSILVTERKGSVRKISAEGVLEETPVAQLVNVREIGEGGLQGITLHPDFPLNGFIYLYYTYSEKGENTLNRVVRMTFADNKLSDENIIIDAIPGAGNHDGGRIKFGPDKYLYVTTGDAQNPSAAQDINSLSGKILRVTDNGDPAPGNPFGNRVYSFGHRNPQGIVWDMDGGLWATEHGPSGLETGNDEFNRIVAGNNYGWPDIRGKQAKGGMETPILESGRSDTWAPAGLAYFNGKFYFVGLRGQALYEVSVNGNKTELNTYFISEYGRLREAIIGPDGMLYITTSNRDGRGLPKSGDDKIIRVNPNKLQ